jgi:serine/threonine protein kinase
VPYQIMDKWLKSNKFAQVNGTKIKPIKNPMLTDIPLSIQKGQAEAFCLVCDTGKKWILKKFNTGKALNYVYLNAVSSLLPRHEAFRAGTERQILSSVMLRKIPGCYYTAGLAEWLDGTILMPKIDGLDWATIADDVRQCQCQLTRSQRVELASNLADLITVLELQKCCHRDISSGNVFIILASGKIYFIDFDSLYHPSLTIPKATTCGTAGYVPPFAWDSNGLDANRTWCPYADRYTTAIIIAEFLTLDKGSPLTAEGGTFSQDELCARCGKGLNNIRKLLVRQSPHVAQLFDSAVNSRDFQSCPSPQDWKQALATIPVTDVKPPALNQIKDDYEDYFQKTLSKARPAMPLWPVPKLSEVPVVDFELLKAASISVALPSNPWK